MIRRAALAALVLSALALVPARAATAWGPGPFAVPAPAPLVVTLYCPGVSPLNVANRNYADGYVVIVDGGQPYGTLAIRWGDLVYTVKLGADGGEALWSRVAWTQDGLAIATLGSGWIPVDVSRCANLPRPFPVR